MTGRKRRYFSLEEKTELVRLSYLPGNTPCGVARAHGIKPAILFRWRAQDKKGGLDQFHQEGKEVVPADKYAEAMDEIKRLQRLLEEANADNALLKDAVELMRAKK